MAKTQKSKNNNRGKKNTVKKTSASTRAPKVKTEYEEDISSSTIVAVSSFALFVLFLVIAINPDGLLLRIIRSILLGMIGQAGFYFAIPAFAYLFFINVFCRKSKITMRNVCVCCFVFLCGCIYHLAIQNQGIAGGWGVFKDLYLGGVNGYTGGVLCGGVAHLMRLSCGEVISYLLLGIAALLTLLGCMEITIPSIIRAIANRPKEDWDEEDEQEDVQWDPASAFVNHVANKKIEKKRQRRERMLQEKQQVIEPEQPPVQKKVRKDIPAATSVRTTVPSGQELRQPTRTPENHVPLSKSADVIGKPTNAVNMMNTIDLDIDTPTSSRKKYGMPPMEPLLSHSDAELEIPDFVPHTDLTGATGITNVPVKEPHVTSKPVAKGSTVKPVTKKEETKVGKVTAQDTEESAAQVAKEIANGQDVLKGDYCFPPIDLLKLPSGGCADGTEEMRENSRRLNETLASFHIDAHIINVTRGPSVTRYEVELDKGVRLNKLTNCADDIALSLGASGVRIAAVPGKISIVGIEVPNQAVTMVSLREVIDSPEFNKAKGKSSFAVGKDIGGSCIVGNIAKMPHMLIAGTTGSGKSVCMNSIIISLLYKSGPDDVKLIMVDPKMVELGIYNGIPHLLIPVVTDPKKAAGSLQWAVTEMMRRYKLMSDMGVRDLESYNAEVLQEEDGKKIPQCIIIIDELADLMLVAAKEVEDSICRIAQMGRAAGMHLIIATQRPSADVITGLMKANIPSRIAFSVASAMESRIILDTQGAEKLVGKGDMLYAPIGIGKPLRVQGCFVTDTEVEKVASYVKANYESDYNQQVLEEIEKTAAQTGTKKPNTPEPSNEELDGDEMLPAAVDVILETGQASVSMLQRRLKLGYARAARIVDEMEEKGIVGPFQGSKPREILITKEEWHARQGGCQMDFGDLEDSAVPEEIN